VLVSDPIDPEFSQPVSTSPPVPNLCHISYCNELHDVMLQEVILRSGFTVEFCNYLASYCNDYVAVINHFNTCTTHNCGIYTPLCFVYHWFSASRYASGFFQLTSGFAGFNF
jgi:hypothetical protein